MGIFKKLIQKKKEKEFKFTSNYVLDETKQREFINERSSNYAMEEIEIEALIRDSNVSGCAYQVFGTWVFIHAYVVDDKLYNKNLSLCSYSMTRDEANEIKNKLCKNMIVKLKIRLAIRKRRNR